MVVQSKKAQFILLFFSLAFILCLGLLGYLFLSGGAGTAAEPAKYYAELILYLSLLFSVITGAVYLLVFLRNRNILKELDKIIEMSSYNNFSPVQSLERLSTIGDKIGQLYKNISIVSEKRALKISALHNLTDFLLNNLSLPVLVTDVRGMVTAVSKQFREKYPDYDNLISSSILTFMPEIKIQRIIDRFGENYSTVEMRQGRNEITVYPIRNREYEISSFVFVIGKGTLVQDESHRHQHSSPDREQTNRGLFTRFLGRRYRK